MFAINIGSVKFIGIFYCLYISYLFIGKKPYCCTSIHKELGNLSFGSVQYIKRELQMLIQDAVKI